MGQSIGRKNTTEEQNRDERNSTEKRTHERKSGSGLCSNWKNVAICSSITIHGNVNIDTNEIEERSNNSNKRPNESNERSNESNEGPNDSVESTERSIESNERLNDSNQVRHKQFEKSFANEMDAGRNLIDLDDNSGRDSRLHACSESTSVITESDAESLLGRGKKFMPKSPYEDRSEVYLLTEITGSSEDSTIGSVSKTVDKNPKNELDTNELSKTDAVPFMSATNTQHMKKRSQTKHPPCQIEIVGLFRHSKFNIEISNARILGIYNRIENRNGKPCYQHSQDTEFKRPYLWYKKGYWVIGPVLGKDKRNKNLRLRQTLSQRNEICLEADGQEIEMPWNHTYEWDKNVSIEVKAIYSKQKGTIRSTSPY